MDVRARFIQAERGFKFIGKTDIKQEKTSDGVLLWANCMNSRGHVLEMKRVALYDEHNKELQGCRYVPGQIAKTFISANVLACLKDGSEYLVKLTENSIPLDKISCYYGLELCNNSEQRRLVPSSRYFPTPPLNVDGKKWYYEEEGINVTGDEVVVYPANVMPLLHLDQTCKHSETREEIEACYTWDLTNESSAKFVSQSRDYDITWKWESAHDEYYITFEAKLVPDDHQPVPVLSPCVVAVFLDGRMKCGFGYISDTEGSIRVSFCQEDLDLEFDCKHASICLSLHLFDINSDDMIGPRILPQCFSGAEQVVTYFMRAMIMAHMRLRNDPVSPGRVVPFIKQFCANPSQNILWHISNLMTAESTGYTKILDHYGVAKEKNAYEAGKAPKGVATHELWLVRNKDPNIINVRTVQGKTKHEFQLIALFSSDKTYDPFTTKHIENESGKWLYQVYVWKGKVE